MSLPIQGAGFVRPLDIIAGRPHTMIGTEGEQNTGKSEFILSAPPPIGMLILDRNIDGVLRNLNPPPSRADLRSDVFMKLVQAPGQGQSFDPVFFMEHWKQFYKDLCHCLDAPDTWTVGIDGDSDSWELQRLAAFGTLQQIPSIKYTEVNAARRAMIRRMYDSGKNIIANNKVTDVYVDETDKDGNVLLQRDGNPRQIKSGQQKRQGFRDHKYLWQIQIRHLYKEPSKNIVTGAPIAGKFGIRILECKPAMHLKGLELWGPDCNFAGLVSVVYPSISLDQWGFK